MNPIALHQPELFNKHFQHGEGEGKGWLEEEEKKGKEEYVTGANAEAAFIGAAICAERSGFVKFREIPGWVRKVYIVSDADVFLSPGLVVV